MGVSMSDVFNTLQVYLGSLYVNDFNRFGRTWQVNVQADATFRKQIEDLKQLKVRNDQRRDGAARRRSPRCATVSGPVMIMRYNMYPAAAINGDAAPGVSSGQAIEQHGERRPSRSLPASMRYEWTELALLQLQTGNTAMLRLRAGGGAGVPGAGGAVRKLVAAAGGDPGRADVPALLDRRRAAGAAWTSTSSRRSASSCWSAWRARTPF